MRRALLRNVSLCSRHLLRPSPSLPLLLTPNPKIVAAPLPFSCSLLTSRFCSSSSDSDSSVVTVTAPELDVEATEETQNQVAIEIQDVSNKEFRKIVDRFIEEYTGAEEKDGGGAVEREEPSSVDTRAELVNAVFKRAFAGEHNDTDEELIEQLQADRMKRHLDIKKPKSNVQEDGDEDILFDHDLDQLETDTDDDLCDMRSIVERKFKENYLNVDDKKWDALMKEQTMQECADILEDMQHFDKLLPDAKKKKMQEKVEELGTRCERGELKPQEAYDLFREFEDEIVKEHIKITEAEGPPLPDKTNEPPGEGPILRWQTRVVFNPSSNAWHPKNRKVKLSVTVKELGLTKHQFRRLVSLVGKRYHPGRDELTITSERFEHREENRKDCLRTLLSLIEDAAKADKLVQDARASYVKERLKANPAFMERLNAKIMRSQGPSTVSALTSA